MVQTRKQQESISINSSEFEGRLEKLIKDAIQKVGGRKENDLCKFLPVDTGGYIHHFTMRKMKTEDPAQLVDLISTFVTSVESPAKVIPKRRAPRGSRKKSNQIVLSKNDLDRMLSIARLAGDKEMVAKLTPKKSLGHAKRELVSSVRQGRVEQELWNAYVEAVASQSQNPSEVVL
ncbi:MAG: hypothetical protein ACI9S8_002974 [Chlamydiales bacterium]|jgi:hypothetical protein